MFDGLAHELKLTPPLLDFPPRIRDLLVTIGNAFFQQADRGSVRVGQVGAQWIDQDQRTFRLAALMSTRTLGLLV